MTEQSPKSKKRAIVLMLTGILVVTAGFIGWHKLGPYHFLIVKPGVLYRGGCQEIYNLSYLVRRYNFKTIVSLREPDEKGILPDWFEQEKEFCRKRGIHFFNIPIPYETPPSTEQVWQWLEIMRNQSQYPVFVHCAQGATRTGVMVALYQITLEHKGNYAAWEQLPRLGHNLDGIKMQKLAEFVLHFDPSIISDQAKPQLLPE